MVLPKMLKWLGLEMIAVIGIGAYILIDASDVYRWWVGGTHFSTPTSACNLHEERCSATLKDGSIVTFEIVPKTIPLMKPLHFIVTTSHELSAVDLKLFATNMNMGFHAFSLKPTQKGVYEGEGTLPTCIVGDMIWQANVILNDTHESLGATFTFKTDR